MSNYEIEFSEHYKKIIETDILFILNISKKGIEGYIGPSVFAEIAFAIGLNCSLGKKIKVYCLNKISNKLPYYEELRYWEQLGWLKFWQQD